MTKQKTLLFLNTGFGDNILTLPLALELEEKADLTVVVHKGSQEEFFSRCLPQAKVIPATRSLGSLFTILFKGWGHHTWIYPIGACQRRLRLLHLLAFFRRAIGFTSLNSEKAWQAEIGLEICLMPDLAKPAWVNNLKLLRLLGFSTQRTWDDYIAILKTRLDISADKTTDELLIHPGSARYAGGLDRFKRWPLDRFVRMAEWAVQDKGFKKASWILGPDDMDLEKTLAKVIAGSSAADKMQIRTYKEFNGSIVKLGQYFSSAKYMLSNDSGLAHLASLYQVPMTTLLSGIGEPTYTKQNGKMAQNLSISVPCQGCCVGISSREAEKFECDNEWACMNELTVDHVKKRMSTQIA